MSMTTPPATARVSRREREMTDAERAHHDMVGIRVEIAMRLNAERRLRATAAVQVAEPPGAPVARRVRQSRDQTAREDASGGVGAEAEVLSKEPVTPVTAMPPSRVANNNQVPDQQSLAQARELLRSEWSRLFSLAQDFPAQAVTSRLSAVAVLHDRATVALFELARVEEHVRNTRVAVAAVQAKAILEARACATPGTPTEGASPVSPVTSPQTERTKGKERKQALVNELTSAEHKSTRMRHEAITLNGSLYCLMEAVDCEARAEMQMAWRDNGYLGYDGTGGRPLAVPREWPSGCSIGVAGAFTGGFAGNDVPRFAPVVPTAPLALAIPIAAVVGAGALCNANVGKPGSTPAAGVLGSIPGGTGGKAKPKVRDLGSIPGGTERKAKPKAVPAKPKPRARPKTKRQKPAVAEAPKPPGAQKRRRAPPKPKPAIPESAISLAKHGVPAVVSAVAVDCLPTQHTHAQDPGGVVHSEPPAKARKLPPSLHKKSPFVGAIGEDLKHGSSGKG